MYQYKLTRIVFNDGTVIEPGNLTVIVGPNNSGKSRVLKEISLRTTVRDPEPNIVLNQVEWTWPTSLEELRSAYDVERYRRENNFWSFRTLMPNLVSEHSSGGRVWPDGYESFFQEKATGSLQFFAESFGNALVAFLTTEHRLQLVKESSSPSHERESANLLQMLYYKRKVN